MTVHIESETPSAHGSDSEGQRESAHEHGTAIEAPPPAPEPQSGGQLARPHVPAEVVAKWQRVVDLMARTVRVPAGLIMRVVPPQIEVFVSSRTEGNPYDKGERADLGTGLYCETVMARRAQLLVPHAMKDPQWSHNPDIDLGMIFYLGFPVQWPDQSVFGTICILDSRENPDAIEYVELLTEFKEIIESDLAGLSMECDRRRVEDELQEAQNTLEARVAERTASLTNAVDDLQRELSERRRPEVTQDLRHLLEHMIDSMPSTLVAVDGRGCVTHWNRHAEECLSVPTTHAEGQPIEKVFPTVSPHLVQVKDALRERRAQSARRTESYVDREKRYHDVMVYPLVGDGIEGAVVRVDDVTERVRLEDMMIQSEKMMSVGGLAAGMAHEINNPLAGIMQNAQVVLDRACTDLPMNLEVARELGLDMDLLSAYFERREITSMLESVRKSGRRAAKIVQNMLDFSRKSNTQFAYHDLGELLDKTVELAATDYELKQSNLFRRIEIVRDYDSTLPKINCERMKLQQVILNLLKNGAQAMCEEDAPPKTPRFILRTARDQQTARIEVEDNGPGMGEDIRRRVFEPFFTTREVGKGAGLGLSVSYYIVTENHGGTMTVTSSPGHGARFIIRLPLEGRS